MNKKMILMVVVLAAAGVVTSFSSDSRADEAQKPGLIGVQYGSEDFTDIQHLSRLGSLQRSFSGADDYGRQWSAKWTGFITAPASGNITFIAESDQVLHVVIADKPIIELQKGTGTAGLTMVKGKKYPIEVSYVKNGQSYNCYFKILWSWAGQKKVPVPTANLKHTTAQEQQWLKKAREAKGDNDNWVYPADEFPIGDIDLSGAKVVVLNHKSKILANAADMLHDEIEKRTRIRLDVVTSLPAKGIPAIVLGVGKQVTKKYRLPQGLKLPKKADGFALWIDNNKRKATTVCLAGVDERGALFAAGRLLRILKMSRDRVGIDEGIKIATAPRYSLRGHQFGYRPKTNSYDGWTVPMWEQYYRDMIVFGMNAVELIPPRSDDAADSPHFPLPQMEMMVEMSRLADEYGLDVWIWYPAIDDDYSDPATVKFALKEREEVFKKLPRIDAVFVPGGDPGDTPPKILLPFMKKQKKLLNHYHPKAQIWVSPQGFNRRGKHREGWLETFFNILQTEQPKWLNGVVFGPQVETSLANIRKEVPSRYPIRRYPDITHCRSSQYAVPNWDRAYRSTEGREPINPRPLAYAKIFRDLQQYAIGFITYSEGCNDDLNKVVWSCLGWDPDMKVEDILKEYSRYFISARYEQKFAEGLLGLEKDWEGRTLTNENAYKTLKIFQEMEKNATPQDLLNWRFQQGLYRAYYDAYIKVRLEYETKLEKQAKEVLRKADSIGSLKALDEAKSILDKAVTNRVRPEWRARVFELAEALFQSVRMQLSVKRYKAIRTNRGANLDNIDKPLTDGNDLKDRFDDIRKLKSEKKRLDAIARIVD